MSLQKYRKPLLTALAWLGLLLGGGFVLLPLLLPFVLAYGLALAAEPGVRFLERRTALPRWARTGLCVTALFAGLGVVLYGTLRVLWNELVRLVRQLPELLTRLQPTLEQLRTWLQSLGRRAPAGLAGPFNSWVDRLFAGSGLVLESVYGALSELVSGIVAAAPRLVIGLITTVIAAYMTSAALPEVRQWLRGRLPAPWLQRLRTLRDRVRAALGGWCRAQLKLLGIVFALLTLGLWVLGVDFPLLFGGLIAALDALPVLGTGTVLLPWALIAFLQGRSSLGFGLLTLYALAALTRTALEPRLVGRQLGLHPLLTLMAFYVGYRLFGVPGMILLPIAAILAKQLVTGREGAVES